MIRCFSALVLTHVPNPAYRLDTAKANPLEIRPVPATFREKGWSYDLVASLAPETGAKAVVAKAFPEKAPVDGTDFTLAFDLLKGPGDCRKLLETTLTSPGKALALALTSSIDPESRAVYKVYSKDAPTPSQRPVLRLTIE